MFKENNSLNQSNPSCSQYLLWEWPIRLFHWLLVLCIVGLVVTQKIGVMDWHGRLGLGVFGLIIYRLVLGFFGGDAIRFSRFIVGIPTVRRYLCGQWHGCGHNPLGGYAILALLTLVSVQAVTGFLSNSDDYAFNGYFYTFISNEWSDRFTLIHRINIKILLAVIALHVLVIIYHTCIKKESLIAPMITGIKTVNSPALLPKNPLKPTPSWLTILAFILAAIAVITVYFTGLGLFNFGSAAAGMAVPLPQPPEAGWYAKVQADRGAVLYAAKCQVCHGTKLDNGSGPALAGTQFFARYGGEPLSRLLFGVHTEMPLNAPDTMPVDQSLSLVAYILQQNSFPAGPRPLAGHHDINRLIPTSSPGGADVE